MVLRGKPARAGVVGAEMHAARCNSSKSSSSITQAASHSQRAVEKSGPLDA
jgi:hypothetical protein